MLLLETVSVVDNNPFRKAIDGIKGLIFPLGDFLTVLLIVFMATSIVGIAVKLFKGEKEGLERLLVWFIASAVGLAIIYILTAIKISFI